MVPLQLHRRQRDMINAGGTLDFRRATCIEQAPPTKAAFELPPQFQTFSVGDGDERFQMVVETDPAKRGQFDQWVFENPVVGELAQLFLRLLRGSGTLIDLGANIGTVCFPVAASGSRVVAVEMLPENNLKLALGALVNRFPWFRVIPTAATDTETIVGYQYASAWGQVSEAPGAKPALGLRLDSILDLIALDSPGFIRAPVVMKIDVEGHELATLHGAERLLRRHRPAFVFESIQSAADPVGRTQETKRFVCELGYSLHVIRGTIIAPHRMNDDQISLVSDILAIPNGEQRLVADRLKDYQMRRLLEAEQIAWLDECMTQGDMHRRHIAALIPRIRPLLPNKAAELDRVERALA
jgi:FkbM family methyltransferase